MRFGKIGKRQYAFGLKWADLYERTAATQVRDSLTDDAPVVYVQVKGADGRSIVGWSEVSAREPLPRGSVYSYAAALAVAGKDGIYVAPVDNERTWYVVVVDGLVVADTDQTLPAEAAQSAVLSMRSALGLDVYVADGFDLGGAFADAGAFDVETIVATSKTPALKRIGRTGAGLNPVLLVLLACGVAGLGWYFVQGSPSTANTVSPAEQAQANRAAYLTAMRAVVSGHPGDSEWAVAAFLASRNTLPLVIGGWRLEGVTCTPLGCDGTYSAPLGEPRVLSPVIERFGRQAVALLPDQNSFKVTLPGTSVPAAQWSDDQILAPLPWAGPATDVSGRVGLNFAGVEVDGPVVTDEVSAMNAAPSDALPFVRERIAIKQTQMLDETRLVGLVAHFAAGGFVATSLTFSSGVGMTPSGWRLEFQRLGGR